MRRVKLTKNALRQEQQRLSQLERYLPTIQLKKGLLQQEVFKARAIAQEKSGMLDSLKKELEACESLFVRARGIDFFQEARVQSVKKAQENIAGIDLPVFEEVHFEPPVYHLFDTPIWTDGLVALLQKAKSARIEADVAKEREAILSHELREVSIRVNLFEKIMIPRTSADIKTIRVFLSDQELMAVARAKAGQKRMKSG